MHQLEKRVERLEAASNVDDRLPIINIVIEPGGNVDTTGWIEVLKSGEENSLSGKIRIYELVPPDKAKLAE